MKLRLYNHKLGNAQAAGRWMKADTGPEIQEAIEHDYTTNIIQAIGRLRGAIRPDYLPLARVLILCNEPVADLKIDVLTNVDELIINPPEKQVFINNSYMKTAESGGSVPVYTAIEEGRDPWNEDLVQDETRQTQVFYKHEWSEQMVFPLLD